MCLAQSEARIQEEVEFVMLYGNRFYSPENDVDDSTNPGSADPWSDHNDGNGTNADGDIW